MAIYSTVDCCAVEGSDSFSFPLEGEPSASVVLARSWENRFTLKNDLLFGLLGFPRPHPEIPGLFVCNVSISGSGTRSTTGQILSYEKALLNVSYAPRNNKFSYTEQVEAGVQMLTLPSGNFLWSDGTPVEEGENPSLQIPMETITHSYSALAVIPSYSSLVGFVNNAPITLQNGEVRDIGTILSLGASSSFTVTADGSDGFDLTLRFQWNPFGWNRFFHATDGTWKSFKCYNGKDWVDYIMYPLGNLSPFFK